MNNIRYEAIQLVDNVLEQSVLIINSQQHSSNTLHSESEHFAITCDVNGVDLIKSPTIESMSGKSFDDNFSVPDVDVDFSINVLNQTSNNNSCSKLVSEHSSDSFILDDTNNTIQLNANKTDKVILGITAKPTTANTTTATATTSDNMYSNNNVNKNVIDKNSIKKFDNIERKFEKLSSQLDIDENNDVNLQYQRDFDMAIANLNADEVNKLQSDFSKISWDDSISATTTDLDAITPDNDIQDLPQGDC